MNGRTEQWELFAMAAMADGGAADNAIEESRAAAAAWEEANRPNSDYYADVCACTHVRAMHNMARCTAADCECRIPYIWIPGRAA